MFVLRAQITFLLLSLTPALVCARDLSGTLVDAVTKHPIASQPPAESHGRRVSTS